MSHFPLVYAIVLTWNSGADVVTCLGSLAAQNYPNLHILVVDNGSTDGTPELVAARFPTAEIVRLAHNTGFAAGNNQGIQRALAAGADYVLLLNDDADLLANALPLLVAAAVADPNLGIVGPAIVSCRDSDLIYLGGAIDWRSGEGAETLATAETLMSPLLDVAYVPGCTLLIKTAVIHRIGLLDERYFSYYEDVDWCLRSTQAGYRCAVMPSARARHQNSADVPKTEKTRSIYFPRRNEFIFLRKHRRPGHWQRLRRNVSGRLLEYHGLRQADAIARASALVDGVWDGIRGGHGGRGGHAPAAFSVLFALAAHLYVGQLRLRHAYRRSQPRVKAVARRLQYPRLAQLGQPLPAPTPDPPGVTVVGYLGASSGMGEAVRGTITALQHVGQPLRHIDIDPAPTLGATDMPPHGAPAQDSQVILLHVNAVNVRPTYAEMPPGFFAGKCNIGFWYWEMPTLPQRWYGAFSLFDEVWVASQYTQSALATVAPIPVVRMRPLVQPAAPAPATRRGLGLPEDRFIYLFSFDALSILERKNPHAVVRAFQAAFGAPESGPLLVMKINNSDLVAGRAAALGLADDYMVRLAAAIDAVNGIMLDRRYDRATTSALMAACDCYVSLHRCEGFGLTMAEAMYFGKPCIATGYSGNSDYMTPANSYLVGYRLVELTRDWGPYEAGDHWAEPDVDHAALLMQEVFAHPAAAARRGQIAAADIRRDYGAAAVGGKMQQRLQLAVWEKQRAGIAGRLLRVGRQ